MTQLMTGAFAILVADHGFEPRSSAGGPSQYVEVVAKPFRFGDTVVDGVTFVCSRDRGDVDRRAVLIGWGENRRFSLPQLAAALGLAATGTDEDFLAAAARLDRAAVERLAPA